MDDYDGYSAKQFTGISDSLLDHLHFAQNGGHKVAAIFLQGAQNYGLETELSDVDTKCITLPSLHSIIKNDKRTSTTLVLPNNEHCDVKDIALMYECFTKSNINFLEILFTEFTITDPFYQKEIADLRSHAEEIAQYDYKRLVNSIIGMACEKRKALTHPYPATIDKIEKHGYDGKQLHHILRLHEFLGRIDAGESFRNCLKSEQASTLNQLKIDPPYSVDEAIYMSDFAIECLRKIRDDSVRYKTATQNRAAKDFLDNSLYKIMKKSIKQDLQVEKISKRSKRNKNRDDILGETPSA